MTVSKGKTIASRPVGRSARTASTLTAKGAGKQAHEDYRGANDALTLRSAPAPYVATRLSLTYNPAKGIGEFVQKIRDATPMELVEVERKGVEGRLLKDIAAEMDIPASRFFSMIGVPKATAEKKASANDAISGAGGQALLGIVRLLGIAQSIVDNSTADVRGFDTAKWLGLWIERPQPALGGQRPSELLDTPTGIEVVSRVLGAVESGAYL